MSNAKPVRRWTSFTKRAVALMLFVLLALVLYRFRNVIPPLMIAFLLAFVLNPIVGFLVDRLHISRGASTGIVFLVLIVIMLASVAAPVTAVPSIQRLVRSMQVDVMRIIADIGSFFERPLEIGGYSLDLSGLYQELSNMLTAFVRSVAQGTVDIVVNIASGALWLIVILTTTFYLVKDADRFIEQFDNLAPPGYREDLVCIRQQVADVWNAFLRGQLVMGLLMVIITTLVCTAIGLPYAIVMGLIAGVTEFIPNVGPIIAFVPAVLVALFKGSSFLAMSNFWFAALVTVLYLVIQQVEGNVLLPRILGSSLNLHPLIVLIGIIIGGSMAGILGMLLAAPVLATLRVISNYIFCRLYDRDPFAEMEEERPPPQPSLVQQTCQTVWCRLQEQVEQTRERASQPEVRPARARDRSAVEAIWAQRDEDYIPHTWDEWLAEPHGELVVARLKGRVVGFAKLSRLADDEWWLQGLRVSEAYRQRGVARLLQTHLVEKARQVGRGTLRFGTHSLNEPVHRLAAHGGFCHVSTYRRYRADPLPAAEAPPLRQLTEADLPAVWALVSESPRHRASGGLYEDLWIWKNVTRERLAHHLAAGDVWGLESPEGEEGGSELSALALIHRTERGTLNAGLVDGRDKSLAAILRGLRGLAAQLGCAEVRVKPVDEPALMAAIEVAGYEQHRDKNIWVFELQLEETAEPQRLLQSIM
jgi:predicted PurR-regulated permease PerM/RimJ/RimL family protein N-acetyltransferase